MNDSKELSTCVFKEGYFWALKMESPRSPETSMSPDESTQHHNPEGPFVPAYLASWISWDNSPQWAKASSSSRLHDHTQTTTICRTPLDEWSARRRDLYLTTHNTHNRQTSIHVLGGIRTYNPSERAAADSRLGPRGHWDRRSALSHCNFLPGNERP